MKITLVCDHCGKEFQRKPSNYQGKKRYCSSSCYHGDRKTIQNWVYSDGCTCKDCGRIVTNGSTRCSRCAMRHRAKSDMRMVAIVCSQCEKHFERSSKRVKPEHNFCSTSCYQTFKRNNRHLDKFCPEKGSGKIDIVCDYCDKVFRRHQSAVIFKNIFCGQQCYGDSMRAIDGFITAFGYKRIWVNGKVVLEHRHVMEQHIGRPLAEDEVVHHIDGNKLNNHIDNLQLMTDTEHKSFHAQMRRKLEPSSQFE